MKKAAVMLLALVMAVTLGACTQAKEVSGLNTDSEEVSGSIDISEDVVVDNSATEKRMAAELEYFMSNATLQLDEDVAAGIRNALTENLPPLAESDLSNVKVSQPVGAYGLRIDDDGAYYWEKSEFCIVFVFNASGCIVFDPETDPQVYTSQDIAFGSDDLKIYWAFEARIHNAGLTRYDDKTGEMFGNDIGQFALLTAADGSYLYDGETITQLENYYSDGGNAELAGVELPAELLAQVELTDFNVCAKL